MAFGDERFPRHGRRNAGFAQANRLRRGDVQCAAGDARLPAPADADESEVNENIFDLFPVQENSSVNYVPLKTFLTRRLFPDRSCLLFYDISGGLTFGSPEMQKMFFEWLEIFDNVENTNFCQQGPPKDFEALAPLLTRFFLKVAEDPRKWKGVTLVIDYPEMLIPAGETSASFDERMNLVTF